MMTLNAIETNGKKTDPDYHAWLRPEGRDLRHVMIDTGGQHMTTMCGVVVASRGMDPNSKAKRCQHCVAAARGMLASASAKGPRTPEHARGKMEFWSGVVHARG